MKKSLLIITGVLFCIFSAQAQGIHFQEISFADALKKAEEEKKTVFIDFHTAWCRPCRAMEKEIFPLKSVGDAYNKSFINLEIDGEKGEGVELVKKYGIKNYPAFLFVDYTGKVLYQFIGGRDEQAFIEEAKRVPVIAKYGGWESFVTKYNAQNASSSIIWDYYLLAREEEKPVVMMKFLKSLPDERLFNQSTGKLIETLSVFDFELYTRLVEGLVARDNTDPEYIFKYTFPVQRNISKQFDYAIERGDTARLGKLMDLKKAFSLLCDRNETDIRLRSGRGLLFASPEFISLTYDAINQENFEMFKLQVEEYMRDLINVDAPLDSTTAWKKDAVQLMEENVENAPFLFYPLSQSFEFMANHILLWTDFYWRNMPSTIEVKKQCLLWTNYAYKINPYSTEIPFFAARLMARLGFEKKAFDLLDEAISIQRKYNSKEPNVVKNLEILRRDIKNNK